MAGAHPPKHDLALGCFRSLVDVGHRQRQAALSRVKKAFPTAVHSHHGLFLAHDSPLRDFLGLGISSTTSGLSHTTIRSPFSATMIVAAAWAAPTSSAIPFCTALRCVQASLSVGIFLCSQPHHYWQCLHLRLQSAQLPVFPSNLFLRATDWALLRHARNFRIL